MLGMSRRRKTTNKAAGTPPKAQRTGVPIMAYVPPELRQALDAYLDNARPSVLITAAIRMALEEFLEKQGYWPPPKPDLD